MNQHSIPPRAYDIAILGGGVAGTYTLLFLLEKLRRRSGEPPVRIVLVDQDGALGTGLPYGPRSALNGLIITTLEEFIPADEKFAFVSWLTETRSVWTEKLRSEGAAAAEWLEDNAAAIDAGSFDQLYIPRRLFGDYLSQRARRAVRSAEAESIADFEEMRDVVVRLNRSNDAYEISLESGRTIVSSQVVLAIGSPPTRSILDRLAPDADDSMVVDDPYSPSFDHTMSTIRERLLEAPTGSRNILIIGTNASSLEVVYALAHDRKLRGILDTVAAVSPSGTFPHPTSSTGEIETDFDRMSDIFRSPACSVREIIEAAESDVARVMESGAVVADAFPQLSRLLVAILDQLPLNEVETFYRDYGMRFSRLIRRAGYDYSDAVAALSREGRLDLFKGSMRGLSRAPHGLLLNYTADADDEMRTVAKPFAVVVNCSGFQDLDNTSTSPLIRDLIRSGLGLPNATRRGFEVDENLQIAPGLVVIGPLLGGVFNERLKLWHVENVRRIKSIAPFVADRLVAGLKRHTNLHAQAACGRPSRCFF